MDLQAWNYAFAKLKPHERLEYLYLHFDASEVLYTSSFGTSSAFLLHLVSEVNPTQKVHFIDTGYLFEETLEYKELIADQFGLDVIALKPDTQMAEVTRKEKTWETDPDLCCQVNKIMPLENIKGNYKIWITGLMGHQNMNRANFQVFEEGTPIKFSPIIDVGQPELTWYFKTNDIPSHPLIEKGFQSVGCTHCTKVGEGRTGRWSGKGKTECGLHLPSQQGALQIG